MLVYRSVIYLQDGPLQQIVYTSQVVSYPTFFVVFSWILKYIPTKSAPSAVMSRIITPLLGVNPSETHLFSAIYSIGITFFQSLASWNPQNEQQDCFKKPI